MRAVISTPPPISEHSFRVELSRIYVSVVKDSSVRSPCHLEYVSLPFITLPDETFYLLKSITGLLPRTAFFSRTTLSSSFEQFRCRLALEVGVEVAVAVAVTVVVLAVLGLPGMNLSGKRLKCRQPQSIGTDDLECGAHRAAQLPCLIK